MVASGSFVPLLPIGGGDGGGVPFIVIVLVVAPPPSPMTKMWERKEGSEPGRPGMDATPIRSKGGSEGTKSTFGQFVTGILNGVCSPPPSPSSAADIVASLGLGASSAKREGGKPINSAR